MNRIFVIDAVSYIERRLHEHFYIEICNKFNFGLILRPNLN